MGHIVRYYSKKSEELLFEEDISKVGVASLRSIFEISEKDPMYDCYELTHDKALSLQKIIDIDIDIDKYDCFVEYES